MLPFILMQTSESIVMTDLSVHFFNKAVATFLQTIQGRRTELQT